MLEQSPGGFPMPDPIIRPSRVAAELGTSSTTLERLRRTDASFPLARKLGARAIGWRRSEITAWRDSRPAVTGRTALPSQAA